MFEVLGVQVSPIAILAAMVVNIIFGMLWYSKLMFGNYWIKLVGKKEEDITMSKIDILGSISIAFLLAVGLNSVLQFAYMAANQDSQVLSEFMNVFLTPAMVTGTFVLTTLGNKYIYEDNNKGLLVLNTAHSYFQNVLMCAVLTMFVIN